MKNILVSTHTLYIDNKKVKYVLHTSDKEHLKKYSKVDQLINITPEMIFYTCSPWNKHNYIRFKKRYYMIEPGYYYYITKKTKVYVGNDCPIYVYHKLPRRKLFEFNFLSKKKINSKENV